METGVSRHQAGIPGWYIDIWTYGHMSACGHTRMRAYVTAQGTTAKHEVLSSWVHGRWVHGYMGTWVHGYMGTWAHGYMGTWVHG